MNEFPRRENPLAMVEDLEPRKLLTAVMDGTQLNVTGTGKADVISVYLNSKNLKQLEVKVNKTVTAFTAASITLIRISAGAGNDKVIVDQTISPINIQTIIYGGAGDDVIQGGAARDRIAGDDGNDTIDGEGGNDIIYGGNGDDRINGENGVDY